MRKRQDFDRKIQNEREKKRQKILGHKKIVSRQISKKYQGTMKDTI